MSKSPARPWPRAAAARSSSNRRWPARSTTTNTESRTIREKLEEFLSDRLTGIGCKPCKAATASLYPRRLLTFDKAFHSVPIEAIGRQDVIAWMKRRLAKPLRGRTVSRDIINGEVDSLKVFAKWAQEKGYAPGSLPLLMTPRLQSTGKLAGRNWRPPQVMDMEPLLQLVDAI